MELRYAILQIGAQREQLLERASHSRFRIIFVIERAPIFRELPQARGGFRGGKSRAAAIYGSHRRTVQFAQRLEHRFLIGMQQTDERAAHQEIETRQSDQRGRIVKHIAGRFLHQSRLLELSAFQQIAQAAAILDHREGGFESGAPIRRLAPASPSTGCSTRLTSAAEISS